MATLSEQLAEAEAAYHTLLIGRAPRVMVDQNGERVEYTAANRPALAAYITELKRQIDTTACPAGPMRVWFS